MINNEGNIYSKPFYKITARGEVNIYVNNERSLVAELGNTTTTLVIDLVNQNATNQNGVYLNRQIAGDYNDLILKVGYNNVKITGDIDEIEITKYSRWI